VPKKGLLTTAVKASRVFAVVVALGCGRSRARVVDGGSDARAGSDESAGGIGDEAAARDEGCGPRRRLRSATTAAVRDEGAVHDDGCGSRRWLRSTTTAAVHDDGCGPRRRLRSTTRARSATTAAARDDGCGSRRRLRSTTRARFMTRLQFTTSRQSATTSAIDGASGTHYQCLRNDKAGSTARHAASTTTQREPRSAP
jgi:hypothetical protein